MTTLRDVQVTLTDYEQHIKDVKEVPDGYRVYSHYIRDKNVWAKITALIHQELGGKYVAKDQGGPYWFVPGTHEPQAKRDPVQRKPTYGTMHCPHCDGLIEFTMQGVKAVTP